MPLARLILFRHGKAEDRAASGLDFDRALAPRGVEDARETGRRLAEAGLAPDLALVSSAKRTLETWAAAAPAFPAARMEPSRGLYNAGADTLMQAAEAADAAAVMIVGHNPAIHALALDLASIHGAAPPALLARLNQGFRPGAAAAFRFDGGRATCEAVFDPKDGPKDGRP